MAWCRSNQTQIRTWLTTNEKPGVELFSASPLSLDNSRKRLLYIKLPDGPQHVQKQRYQRSVWQKVPKVVREVGSGLVSLKETRTIDQRLMAQKKRLQLYLGFTRSLRPSYEPLPYMAANQVCKCTNCTCVIISYQCVDCQGESWILETLPEERISGVAGYW